ncbi:hypothetical protein TNCV_2192301 [Trichonephila clavipes]|nr:hypothetical protein TNCV_2192301 [Trichonephila clavipes]
MFGYHVLGHDMRLVDPRYPPEKIVCTPLPYVIDVVRNSHEAQWLIGIASRFHTAGRGSNPRQGKVLLNLSFLQWVDK